MDMSRLSFRPRPLDIHKKLPIFRSIKDFEDDETTTSTRNSQIQRIAAETDIEVPHNNSKKNSAEIPIPQFVVVDTYERDYACTFTQPSTYVRARGARSELGEYVEYDLDNEDIDWLEEFNLERKIITPEKLESTLFKLEVLDHKARERAGVIMPTLGSPVPVHLTLEVAAESLQSSSVRFSALQPIYSYWKQKRERWQKPILRKLQPPPPINDTNPYNVFRPREKIHRLHTRRMQRRENNIQSFEKLRLVRRNLQQAKTMLEALIKREEKKREAMDCEVNLQRLQMKYKNDTRLIDDGVALPTFSSFKAKHALTEEDLINSNEMENGYSRFRQPMKRKFFNVDSKWMMTPVGHMKYKSKRGSLKDRWLHEREPHEPIMLFTGSLDPEKLAAAGITEPPNPQIENDSSTPLYHFRGRIGRGGRIIFDRWNPF